MDDFLLALASFVIMLVPMIFLHELGHFIAAKLVGITVLEFGLGFPPRATKLFEHKGTEYTLNWIPLGGFVRPLGEDFVRPVGDDEATGDWAIARERGVENPKSVNQAGPWQRIFFMSAGAGANLITAILVFAVMALLGLPVVKGATVAVRSVADASPAAVAGLESGDVIVRVDDDYIDSSSGLIDYLTTTDQSVVNLTVERDAETFETTLNLETAGGTDSVENVVVLGVVVDSPADQAGLQPDDMFLAANGNPINSTNDLVEFTNDHRGESIELLIEREGEQLTVELVPRVSPPADEGPIGVTITSVQTSGTVGLTFADRDAIIDYESAGLVEAFQYGVNRTGETIGLIINAPLEIIRGNIAPEMARPLSIVGISQLGGQRIEESFEFQNALPILDFAAVISLALGITNLLPIPGLDGGRILFVFIELLRGKPMDPEREGMVHLVGLLILLGTMSIVIINDIINPITTSIP